MDWFLYDNGLRHEGVKEKSESRSVMALTQLAAQLTFTCSKSSKETLEKGVKYVQS